MARDFDRAMAGAELNRSGGAGTTEPTRPVVLYLTRNLRTGGAERVFVSFVNNARAVQPVVALLERAGALLTELRTDVACVAHDDQHRLRAGRQPAVSGLSGESVAQLGRECLWLDRIAQDTAAALVSSFLMRAHIVALLTKLLLRPRLRVVLNIHEHLSESEPFFYATRRDKAVARWVIRHLFPRADRIVVVADALKRDLVAAHGVPADLIDVVHNPLDIERIRTMATEPLDPAPTPGPPPGRRRIVAVGRLVHLKGYDLLLQSIERLRATHDVHLTLVGDGSERGRLEALAARLDLLDAVTFAGHQDNPWRFMAQADVLALTSRTEAFPCVLAEAMAIGVPVLATDCTGGVRELLQAGACGLIVPSENVDAIAGGLERLLSDAALRASLTATARERVDAFAVPRVQGRYESLLTGLMAARAT